MRISDWRAPAPEGCEPKGQASGVLTSVRPRGVQAARFQQRREGFVDLKVLEDNLRAQRLYESAGMYVVRRELVPDL